MCYRILNEFIKIFDLHTIYYLIIIKYETSIGLLDFFLKQR
jgi:hypothetical protein